VIVLVLAVTMLRPAPAPAPAASTAPAAATQPARPRSSRGQQKDPAAPVAAVKLKALTEAREEPGDTKRNPFRFQPKFVPPPPKPVVTAPVMTDPGPPKPPPGPPPVPPIALKFIGVLERANGTKWAVLTDGKTPTPMYGKDGDIIDGRYQIVKIGTESIEMTYADGRGRTVIRLTGQ